MKQSILGVIMFFLFTNGSALASEPSCKISPLVKGKCFTIVGTLHFYNGWPPFLRIESKNEMLYGVGPVENELIPKSIRKVFPNEIEGQFEFCPFGETTSVPYEKRKIEMGCIESVQNAWYYDGKSGKKRKLK
jgi:hypothetical protein